MVRGKKAQKQEILDGIRLAWEKGTDLRTGAVQKTPYRWMFRATKHYFTDWKAALGEAGLTYDEVKDKVKELVSALFNAVPCGVGSKGKLRLIPDQLDKVLIRGVNWAVDNGYGIKDDIEHMEENGCMEGADPLKVSEMAKKKITSSGSKAILLTNLIEEDIETSKIKIIK